MENVNQIQLFTNSVFGEVRAIKIEDKVWFVGRDAVKSLGYEISTKSYTYYINKFVKEKYMKKVNNTESVLFGMTDAGRKGETLINQYGIIQLVMNSSMEEAEQFQDWILEEVIPSVLATGEYKYNKKEEKQKFNPLQECALIVFGEDSSDVEKVNALNNLHKISIMQGERMICDDSMITIPQIREMVYKHYGEELDEKGAIVSDGFIEFNRYMKYAGYLHTIQFPRKDGRGLEKMYTYQPTKLFDEVLVAQGMATVRTLSDDRGKVEITYTKNIENLIVTESFKESFFKYIQLTTPMCV